MDVVDHLIEPAGDPVPPGARVGIVETVDRVRLRWATFEAPRPRGTVLLLQGRAEYIECYYETIRDLQARGLSVVTFDWRGQGGSQRLTGNPRKGHVPTVAAYDFDLDAILRHVGPASPKPWYVLAHSTGGLVAIANRARLAGEVRRLVLIAPFLGLGTVGPAEPIARALARGLRAVGFGRDWIPGGGATPIHTMPFDKNFLTSDPVRHAKGAETSWRHPELAIGSPTVGWLAAAFDAMDRVLAPEALAAWRMPALIFSCGDDCVVSNAAIERFSSRTTATDHLVIPGARHELLKERDRFREQFWAAFDAFVPGSDAPPVDLPKPPAPAEPPRPAPAEPPADAPTPSSGPETDPAAIAAIAAVTALATAAAATPSPAVVAPDASAETPQPTEIDPATSRAAAQPQPADADSQTPGTMDETTAETPAEASAVVGETLQHDLVQAGIAGSDDAAAVDGAAAVPGGDDAAGALDHRDQGHDVVGLQPGLDHHVDEAGGDHAVGVAVDPVARQPDP